MASNINSVLICPEPGCGKTVKTKYLKIHIKNVHGSESKIISCPEKCGYSGKAYFMKDHIRNVHGPGSEVISCPEECGYSCKAYAMKKHIKNAHWSCPHGCGFTGKGYYWMEHIRKVHHGSEMVNCPAECGYSGKAYAMKKPQAAMLEPKFSHPEAPPMHNGLSYPLTALFSATPGLLAEAIMHKRAPL